MIQQSLPERSLKMFGEDSDQIISLMDIFDGFNISYSYSPIGDTEYEDLENLGLIREKSQWYMLEPVTEFKWAQNAFVHDDFLFVIYQQYSSQEIHEDLRKTEISEEYNVYNLQDENGVPSYYKFSDFLHG